MADKQYSFIVVKYPNKATGELALEAVVALSKEDLLKLKDAVAITKTESGKIKLHQTKDDGAKKGLLKGGAIGILFALLFGPAGWVVAGAALGTAFSMFDRGIKNKLLKELGEKMTSDQSAMAVLIEEANWYQVLDRMRAHNFQGEIVIKELVANQAEAFEQYLSAPPPMAGAVPDEVSVEPAVDAIVGDAAEASAEAAPAEDAPTEEAPAEEAPAADAGAPAEGEEKPE